MHESTPAVVDADDVDGYTTIDPADLRESDVIADVFGGRKPIARITRHTRSNRQPDVIQVRFTDGQHEPFLAGSTVIIHTPRA